MRLRKQILSVLLASCLTIGNLPLPALAAAPAPVVCGTIIDSVNIANANGKPIEYRTVVRNFADQPRNLMLETYIMGTDGTKRSRVSETYTVEGGEIKSLTAVIPAQEQTQTPLPNVHERSLKLDGGSRYTAEPVDLVGYEYTGCKIHGTFIPKGEEIPAITLANNGQEEIIFYYTLDRGQVTLKLMENGREVSSKVRYVDRPLFPQQQIFRKKQVTDWYCLQR